MKREGIFSGELLLPQSALMSLAGGTRLFALLLLLLPFTSSMRGSNELTVNYYDVGILASFDYSGEGVGGFSWELSLSDPSDTHTTQEDRSYSYVFLCTDDELSNNVLSTYSDAKALCAATPAALAAACSGFKKVPSASGSAGSQPLNGTLAVASRVTLSLMFAVCPCPSGEGCSGGGSQALGASWHSFNPGGEELPYGEIPLKRQEVDFAITWCVLGAAWVLNLALGLLSASRGGGEAVRLVHYCLLLPPLFFAVEGFVGAAYWASVSTSGRDNLSLSILSTCAWDFASAALVFLIMRLARGWQITRGRLTAFEERNCGALTVFYLLSWAFWQYSYTIMSLFSLILSYALILQYSASSTEWSLRLLGVFRTFSESLGITQQQRQAGGSGGGMFSSTSSSSYQSIDQQPPPGDGAGEASHSTFHAPPLVDSGLSERQVTFLSAFRVILIAYLTVDMLCELASDLFFAKAPWVSEPHPLCPLRVRKAAPRTYTQAHPPPSSPRFTHTPPTQRRALLLTLL